jgi:hypothetical protein
MLGIPRNSAKFRGILIIKFRGIPYLLLLLYGLPQLPPGVKKTIKNFLKIVLSGQQKPGLILDVSTPLGPELHMDMYKVQMPLLHQLNLSYT